MTGVNQSKKKRGRRDCPLFLHFMNETVRRKVMEKKEYYIPSKDGIHRLHVVLWEPDTPVKAVVQISHGMVEMIDRYEEFPPIIKQNG